MCGPTLSDIFHTRSSTRCIENSGLCFNTVCTAPSCVCPQVHTVHVCRGESLRSTAGVTLISGVILSSSPRGCVRLSLECLAGAQQAAAAQAAQARRVHAAARAHGPRDGEGFRREHSPSYFLSPAPLISLPLIPLAPALRDDISANRCLSIHLSTFTPDRQANRRRRCERHGPLSPWRRRLPLPPSLLLLLLLSTSAAIRLRPAGQVQVEPSAR